jgi:hypothetical protein
MIGFGRGFVFDFEIEFRSCTIQDLPFVYSYEMIKAIVFDHTDLQLRTSGNISQGSKLNKKKESEFYS